MADIGRTTTLDPLCEKFYGFSPYSMFNNNPLLFIDPDGMSGRVYITGSQADEATQKLDESSNLQIERNEIDGQLAYSGTPQSESDKELAKAIDDEDVVVQVKTGREAAVTSDGTKQGNVIGGAFGGSRIAKDGTIVAEQYVEMKTANAEENAGLNKAGTIVAHEIHEGYQGAIMSPGAKANDNNAYIQAHGRSLEILPLMQTTLTYDPSTKTFYIAPATKTILNINFNVPLR